jgi:RNA:NAD 2'-phosphotransferase (TPT1/KptA family)
MFHVTDESNVESILEDGLQPSGDGNVYFTDNAEDAEFLGEAYATIDDPVVLEAEIMEKEIYEGPGDAGDIDEYVKFGKVWPVDLKVA